MLGSASTSFALSFQIYPLQVCASRRAQRGASCGRWIFRHDIRRDALRLDRASARRAIACGGELDRRVDQGQNRPTEPLPKVWVPRTTARLRSWSAPATISDAEAEPPLTRTTIGTVSTSGGSFSRSRRVGCPAGSPGLAVSRIFESSVRPSVYTTNAFWGRNIADTATAPFSRPPGCCAGRA